MNQLHDLAPASHRVQTFDKFRMFTAAVKDPRLSPAEYKVLTLIGMEHTRRDGKGWKPIVLEALAEDLGIKTTQLRRHLAALLAAGYLVETGYSKGGRGCKAWRTWDLSQQWGQTCTDTRTGKATPINAQTRTDKRTGNAEASAQTRTNTRTGKAKTRTDKRINPYEKVHAFSAPTSDDAPPRDSREKRWGREVTSSTRTHPPTEPGIRPPTTTPHDPPPRTCLRHPNGTREACGPCVDARRDREAWDQERRHRAAEQHSAAVRARGQDRRARIEACLLCDENGYRDRSVCDHDPHTEERNRRGSAKCRAMIERASKTGAAA